MCLTVKETGERERVKTWYCWTLFLKFLPPSKWGFSFIFITIRTSAVWYLQLSEEANPMKVVKMTQSYCDSVPLPHALSSQMSKKNQSLNCSQGALLQSKPQMFQSQPHFACTVHFLSSMPSFFLIKTSIAALPSSRKPGESHKNRVVHHHAIVLKLRLRGQKPETSSVVLFYF